MPRSNRYILPGYIYHVTHRCHDRRRVADTQTDRPPPVLFYSNEGSEAPNVHVQQERKLAKFWLEPVRLAWSTGFAGHELSELRRLVLERWNDYFER